MKNINDMTEDEKREYVQSWVRDLDEFALEEVLIEFCGFGDGNSPAMHEPEPPKLRPMSELPEVGTSFNVYIKDDFHEKPWWQIGKQSPFRGGINSGGSYYEQSENVFKDPYTRVILGWLPLPSPNDIKL